MRVIYVWGGFFIQIDITKTDSIVINPEIAELLLKYFQKNQIVKLK